MLGFGGWWLGGWVFMSQVPPVRGVYFGETAPLPYDHHRTLFKAPLRGPRSFLFLMS